MVTGEGADAKAPYRRLSVMFARALPPASAGSALVAGVGSFLAIGALITLDGLLSIALLIAPFGASCVLIFALPSAPLAQPANVVFGHAVSAGAGLLVIAALPDFAWSPALGVGLAVAAMVLLRVTHPPAGANPIVVSLLDPGWLFVLVPVLLGAVALVLIGVAFHRVTGKPYPVRVHPR
ncbi:MAG: HPP family protein [Pseudomonadota bacterium]